MAILKGNTANLPSKRAIALNLGDLRFQGDAMLAEAQQQAAETVRRAQCEREALIATAAADGRGKGFAAGYAEGAAKGASEGRAQAMADQQATLLQIQEAWMSSLVTLEQARADLMAESSRRLLQLAVSMAERVLKRQIECDATVVVDQVAHVLGLVMRSSRLVVHVAPQDESIVTEALPKLMERLAAGCDATVQPNAAISRGSCVLRMAEAAGGEMNAEIEVQLARIAEAIVPKQGPVNLDAPRQAEDASPQTADGSHPAKEST